VDIIEIETKDGKRFVNLAQVVDARWQTGMERLRLFTTAPDERGVVVFEGAEALAVVAALRQRAQPVGVPEA